MAGKLRSQMVLAVDWDARTVRFVHAQIGKRGVKIDRVFSVGIPEGVDPANPEQMGRHIREALDQEDIRTRHTIVDIPRDQAILNTLRLPATAPQELPGMVEIQIAKELPFPVGDAVVDFAVAPPEGDAVTAEVLVAAVRHEVLQQYEATFAAAGLRLARIGFRPYANKVAVCAQLKHALPERVLMIDVRPTLSEIDILRNGALEFSRAAPVVVPSARAEGPRFSIVREPAAGEAGDEGKSGAEEPGAEGTTGDIINALVIEARRSIEAYRAGDPGAQIDHVVIGGDVGIEEALAEAIQRQLHITTEMYNPASSFGWDPDEGAAAGAFAATLGLVLAQADETALHFDFLHPKKTESATQQRLRKAPLVAAVVVVFAAAGGIALHETTKHDREELAEIEQRIAEAETNIEGTRKFRNLVEEVELFDEQHVWVDVLHDVLTALPSNEELVVDHISVSQSDHRVVLKTRAKRRETATEVIRALEEFRRAGHELPRFKVRRGTQKDQAQEKYPFEQDLRIEILRDGPGEEGATARSG